MKQLQQIQAYLAGKTSYIIGALMVLTALEKYISGDTTLSQFVTTVQGLTGMNGLAVLALRAAVSKVTVTKA